VSVSWGGGTGTRNFTCATCALEPPPLAGGSEDYSCTLMKNMDFACIVQHVDNDTSQHQVSYIGRWNDGGQVRATSGA